MGGGGRGRGGYYCFLLFFSPKGQGADSALHQREARGVNDCLVSIISFLDKLLNCLVKFSQVPC